MGRSLIIIVQNLAQNFQELPSNRIFCCRVIFSHISVGLFEVVVVHLYPHSIYDISDSAIVFRC